MEATAVETAVGYDVDDCSNGSNSDYLMIFRSVLSFFITTMLGSLLFSVCDAIDSVECMQ